MTMTLDPTTDARLDDFEYEAAIERLRAYVAQLDQAEYHADAGSLQRAADLKAIYDDKRWVKELPPVKAPSRPGAFQTIADSRNRFATKWATDKVGLRKSQCDRLFRANQIATTVSPAGETVGERTLRPMFKLIAQGRIEEAPDVWQRALDLADGRSPIERHVRQAMNDHDKAMGYTKAKQVEMSAQVSFENHKARIVREWRWVLTHNPADKADEIIAELDRVYDEFVKQVRS